MLKRFTLATFVAVCVSLGLAGCVAKTQAPGHKAHPVDFSGMWERDPSFEVVRPEFDEANYTEAAKARIDEFRRLFPEAKSKWPMDMCLQHGMPWTSLMRSRTYATEIIQNPDRIIVLYELFDERRDIRLDKTEVPSNFGPSNQGYSFARWEGETLVIETSGLLELSPYSDMQRSSEAHILEHWQLVNDDSGEEFLLVELWVTDPEVYKEPAYGRKRWRRMPEGSVIGGYNCNNALWEDHVEAELQLRENAASASRGK